MSYLGKRKHASEEKSSVKRRRFDSSKNKKQMSLLSSKGEMKCVDLTSTSATIAIDSTANKTLLNAVIAGNAIQNRLARRIRMHSLRIMGQIIQTQAGAAPVDDLIHVFVVYDKQPNAAAFVVADLLQVCDAGGTTGTTNFSFQNMSNAKRFKILRHWKRKVEVTGAAINQPAQETTDYTTSTTLDLYVPLRDCDTQYNAGAAGTITDIQSGALYLLVLGGQSAANSQYSLQYNARLRFVDL